MGDSSPVWLKYLLGIQLQVRVERAVTAHCHLAAPSPSNQRMVLNHHYAAGNKHHYPGQTANIRD
jgi:hypothetical protein